MSIFQGLALPKTVFETDSDINGHIMVIDAGTTRKLSVGGIIQSVNHNSPVSSKRYWGRAVESYKEIYPEVNNLLVLGMGGATLLHLMSKAFEGLKITAVEIDPVMVKIAEDYFDAKEVPNLHVIVGDALKVLASPDSYNIPYFSFDSVFVDIYIGDKYPDLGETGTFITGLKKVVKHEGWIVFNRLYWDYHQDDVNAFIEDLHLHFSEIKSIVVAGRTNSDNVLIFCKNT